MALDMNDILTMLNPGYAAARGGAHLYKHGGKELLFGTSPQQQRTPIYTSGQEDILNQLMQQGSENLDFSNIENIEQKRFQEETIPSIAERFTSMGAGGQRSSAFQSSLGRASSDLGTRLGGLRAAFGGQQLGMGLQPRYQTSETPGQQGILQGMGGSIATILPMLLQLLAGA